MNRSRRLGGMAAIACGLAVVTAAGPASAPNGVGVSKAGGSTSKPPTTQSIAVALLGSYYGVGGSGSTVATGSATLTFDSTQSVRTMSVTASNVQMPDGTRLHVNLSSNALFQATAYYPIWATQSAGSLTLVGNAASESISTSDGLSVPLFGSAGQVVITAYSANGVRLGTVLSGSYSLLARGGVKTGGHP